MHVRRIDIYIFLNTKKLKQFTNIILTGGAGAKFCFCRFIRLRLSFEFSKNGGAMVIWGKN